MKLDPLTLACAALFQPLQLAQRCQQSYRIVVGCAFAAVFWWSSTTLSIWLFSSLFVPISQSTITQAVGYSSLIALPIAYLGAFLGSNTFGWKHTAMWLLRSQLTTMPWWTVFIVLMVRQDGILMSMWWPVGSMLIGITLGDTVATVLLLHTQPEHRNRGRMLVGVGSLALAVLVFMLPESPLILRVLISIGLLGCTIGVWYVFRLCWQILLSILLWLAARLGVEPLSLRWLHPADFDMSPMVVLPGLSYLLCWGCRSNIVQGNSWLLAVALHAGQRPAAIKAVNQLAQEPHLSHKTLMTLTKTNTGRKLLQDASASTDKPNLAYAYAALSSTPPHAWCMAIQHVLPLFIEARHFSQGQYWSRVIEFAHTVLLAQRICEIELLPTPLAEEAYLNASPSGIGFSQLNEWVMANSTLPLKQRVGELASLEAEMADTEDWLALLLIDTVAHLRAILEIEKRQAV